MLKQTIMPYKIWEQFNKTNHYSCNIMHYNLANSKNKQTKKKSHFIVMYLQQKYETRHSMKRNVKLVLFGDYKTKKIYYITYKLV